MTNGNQTTGVSLNGGALTQAATPAALDGVASGWANAGGNLILAKSDTLPVATAKTFVFALVSVLQGVTATFQCRNGTTVFGQSVYVVGNVAELGNWNAAQALQLSPNGPYPLWTSGKVSLPPNTGVEWKCIKRAETGDTTRVDLWQPGPNNALQTPASGDAGVTVGDFNGGGSVGSVSVNFICDNGTIVPGQSVYVAGAADRLGNWDLSKAVKLTPTNYPRWTGTVDALPAGKKIEWKCLKLPEGATQPAVWQPGGNNVVTTPPSGSVTAAGNFQP